MALIAPIQAHIGGEHASFSLRSPYSGVLQRTTSECAFSTKAHRCRWNVLDKSSNESVRMIPSGTMRVRSFMCCEHYCSSTMSSARAGDETVADTGCNGVEAV